MAVVTPAIAPEQEQAGAAGGQQQDGGAGAAAASITPASPDHHASAPPRQRTRWQKLKRSARRVMWRPKTTREKIVSVATWILLLGAAVATAVFATPPLTKHVIIPVLRYLNARLPQWALILVCALAIIVLPIFLLPWRTFVWLAAFSLGAGWSFLLATAASTVGMAIPFILARHGGLSKRVSRWAGHRGWYRTLVLAVADAGPLKTVLLMRLGPSPYALLNYAAALPPSIPFWRYLLASIIGHLPDTGVHVSIGAGARGLSAALEGSAKGPPAVQAVRYILPIVASLAIAVIGTIYCRRALAKIRAAAEGGEGEGGGAAVVVPGDEDLEDSDDDDDDDDDEEEAREGRPRSSADVEMGGGRGSGWVAPA